MDFFFCLVWFFIAGEKRVEKEKFQIKKKKKIIKKDN